MSHPPARTTGVEFDGDLDTTEMLYDVGAERPHDEADIRLDDQISAPGAGPPPYLSPSSASTFRSCAKRWKFRYIDRLADPAGEAALAGTFAHRVLELVMDAPASERTIDRAREIARSVWPETEADPDFVALALDDAQQRRFRWLGWTAIEGLWRLENPSDITVVATEQKVDTHLGDVPFRGIVDRLERENARADAGLIVSDYKSGRAPSQRFQKDRLDQVMLYAAAVEAASGERPRAARLLYLGQCVIETEVTPELLDASMAALHDTWSSIDQAVSSATYEATPGPLCGWCPYAGQCEEGLAELELRRSAGRIRSSAPSLRFLAAAS